MVMSRKPAGYWSKERCQKEALKYDKRWGFGKSSRVAYEMARKNGWLDDICSHMIIENIEERYIYCIWFDDECVYVGISCNPKNRFAQHLSGKKSSVYKYITENNCNPILKIITEEPVTEKEAQELECYYIDKYKAEGYCVINKQSGGGLGTSTIKWTKEKVIEESLKYKGRVDFKKGSRGAYNAAIKNGWLDDIPLKQIKPNNYWNKEKVIEESLKYKCRSDFHKGSAGAYEAARKNVWLDEIYPPNK